ncbi:6-phospho-3-hexuloisomerase [Streptomyces sp. NPDC048448]|uniref:6-phospho-3-hexuloisomerase n=1 Tax=Streptomyces sp. NPDC048448 TaxID=3365554 RepID=UPI003713BBD9
MVQVDEADGLALVIAENSRLAQHLNRPQFQGIPELIRSAPAVFVTGAGRSGLALKMAAMRLMHLGITVHVVGEVTTPAIKSGDLLIAASGSGTTPGVVRAIEKSREVEANVLLLTTAPESAAAKLATHVITVPAAQKLDTGSARSEQYAGSLFEQAVLLITDGLFSVLWRSDGSSASRLWDRHANLE